MWKMLVQSVAAAAINDYTEPKKCEAQDIRELHVLLLCCLPKLPPQPRPPLATPLAGEAALGRRRCRMHPEVLSSRY